MRRLSRPIALLIVAAQLLLVVPAMAATASLEPAACAGMADHGGEACPCCPDGVQSMKDCLASCLLAAVISSSFSVPTPASAPGAAPLLAPPPLRTASDPPLKPPPIA